MRPQALAVRNCGPDDETRCETSEPGERLCNEEELLSVRLAIGKRILEVFGFGEAANIVFRLKSTPDEVQAVLNGERLPSTEFLLAVQNVTGASIDWLLTGIGERYVAPAERTGTREAVHRPQRWFVTDDRSFSGAGTHG
jgi:hypothetical protein